MAYCVKCGVELASSEAACPLCKTVVCHPEVTSGDGERLYPRRTIKQESRLSDIAVMFVISFIFAVSAIIVFLCDLKINGEVTWSGYVLSSLALGYIVFFLPFWFRKRNPVIFIPCDFAAVILFLLYMCLKTDGNWFMTLAFPITGAVGAIVTAVITLERYIGKGHLYIFGGSVIAFGVLTVLIEILINITFKMQRFIFWSIYPLVGFFLIGMFLIVIAICKPLREALRKKFFI